MRLDKFLANMGKGSRKDVKKLIASGKVMVNGAVERSPERVVSVENGGDVVEVFGERLSYKQFVYIMMNKPAGVISATNDEHGDIVATELVCEDFNFYELSPAGRLDKDSEGFLLLTNDGAFIHNIISPGHKVDKVYFVKYEGTLAANAKEKFEKGIILGDGYHCLPAKIENNQTEQTAFVTINEGKFHQVKRMIAAVGGHVTYLKRLSIGGVELDESLKTGEYRELTEKELEILKNEEAGN